MATNIKGKRVSSRSDDVPKQFSDQEVIELAGLPPDSHDLIDELRGSRRTLATTLLAPFREKNPLLGLSLLEAACFVVNDVELVKQLVGVIVEVQEFALLGLLVRWALSDLAAKATAAEVRKRALRAAMYLPIFPLGVDFEGHDPDGDLARCRRICAIIRSTILNKSQTKGA